jgi:hypothetical protein
VSEPGPLLTGSEASYRRIRSARPKLESDADGNEDIRDYPGEEEIRGYRRHKCWTFPQDMHGLCTR